MKSCRSQLILALFLSTLLAGCSSSRGETGPDRPGLPDTLRQLSYEEHYDISIGYWGIDRMAKEIQHDGVWQYIEELFNITIHPVSVTWADYQERYQILSVTDNLPDLFATLTLSSSDPNDSAVYVDLIENHSIRALPRDLSAFPLLEEVLESVSYIRHTDGCYYAIPRCSFTNPCLSSTDAALLVRRDWMDTLGLDDPQSLEEFLELLAAFVHDDPDGNGVDDTIGYNVTNLSALGKWVILGIAPRCNVYSWVLEDGRYIPSWSTEDFKAVVRAYRTMYEEGTLDPQFHTKSTNAAMEDFVHGRLGALEYKSSPSALMELENQWNLSNRESFAECVDVLPIFPAPDGVRYSNSSSLFWSESYIASTVEDPKLERILALMEYLLSPEGQRLCRYGLAGTDYRLNEDGNPEFLFDAEGLNPTQVLVEKYPSLTLFSGIASWGGSWADFEDTEWNRQYFGDTCVQLARKSVRWYQENTTQLMRPYDFLLYPKEASGEFGTSQAFHAFIGCITGEGDPVEMWEQVLEDMRSNGLDAYIDRQNDLYRRQ